MSEGSLPARNSGGPSHMKCSEYADFVIIADDFRTQLANFREIDRSISVPDGSYLSCLQNLFETLYSAAIHVFLDSANHDLSTIKEIHKAMKFDIMLYEHPYARRNPRIDNVFTVRKTYPATANKYAQIAYNMIDSTRFLCTKGKLYKWQQFVQNLKIALRLRMPVDESLKIWPKFTHKHMHKQSDGRISGILLGGRIATQIATKGKIFGDTEENIEYLWSGSCYLNQDGIYMNNNYTQILVANVATKQYVEYNKSDVHYQTFLIISKYHLFIQNSNAVVRLDTSGTRPGIIKKYRPYFKMYKRYGDKTLCNKVYVVPIGRCQMGLPWAQLEWNGKIIFRGTLANWQLHTDGWFYLYMGHYAKCVHLNYVWRCKKVT